jgi:hypothetical protein
MTSVRVKISLPEEAFREHSRDIEPRKRSRFISNSGTPRPRRPGLLLWYQMMSTTLSPIVSMSPITSNVTKVYSFEVETLPGMVYYVSDQE